MSARTEIAAALKPLLPKSWKIVPYGDSLDVVSNVTVMVKLTRIEKVPTAPLGAYLSHFTITVIDPSTDPAKSEDRLDDEVHALLAALDGINNTLWTQAEKVLFSETNLAWDIQAQAVTTKE